MRRHGLIALARRLSVAIAATLACAVALSAAAHDIPTDVKINAFVKPAGKHLELLIRVPLAAMIEVDIPTRGPGYLELSRADEALRNATKLHLIDNITVYENGATLPPPRILYARASLASDRSFTSYEQARAHVEGPRLSDDLELYWNQQFLDVLLEYPIQSDRSEFAIRLRVDRLGQKVSTALRFLPPDGATRAFELHGDAGLVRLDPRWHQSALRFVVSGFWHILEGTDHLLFLFCLVIPFRRFRALVPVVTAFTVAHSVTLIASAYNLAPDALWFPPLIETLIAISIVYMALENIVGGSTVGRRWMMAFGFGLVHGFGFSFALRQTLQFAGSHLLTSLLSFNVGVELGQLLVLVALIPTLEALFRFAVAERMGTIILSALVAHTGWHWMQERADKLSQFPFQWPVITTALLANALRWLMVLVFLAALYWLFGVLRQKAEHGAEEKTLGERAGAP